MSICEWGETATTFCQSCGAFGEHLRCVFFSMGPCAKWVGETEARHCMVPNKAEHGINPSLPSPSQCFPCALSPEGCLSLRCACISCPPSFAHPVGRDAMCTGGVGSPALCLPASSHLRDVHLNKYPSKSALLPDHVRLSHPERRFIGEECTEPYNGRVVRAYRLALLCSPAFYGSLLRG